MRRVDVVVRCKSDTYLAAAFGMRASCTGGPQGAAERLGEKLFGESFMCVTRLPAAEGDDHTVTRWKLTGSVK